MPRQGVSTTAAGPVARAGLALALTVGVVVSAVVGLGAPLDVATGGTRAAPAPGTVARGLVEPLAVAVVEPAVEPAVTDRRTAAAARTGSAAPAADVGAAVAATPVTAAPDVAPVVAGAVAAPVAAAPVEPALSEPVAVEAVRPEPVRPEPVPAAATSVEPVPVEPASPGPAPRRADQVVDPASLPSPAPAALLAPGTVKPDAGNTGVPSGTPLRVVVGDMEVTTAGAVIDGIDLRGFLRVKAPNVTVTRSIIRGGPAVRVEGVVTVSPAATNFVIQDSEVYPSSPSVMLDGIKGGNFTARRVHVHGGVDNIKVHGSNVLIEASYLHHQDYYASDPLQRGGPTHNDALQILGGDRISVVGNTLVSHRDLNAAVQVTQDFAPITRLELLKNWIDGGGCSVNINHKKLGELRDVVLRENVFGRATRYGNCGVILTTKTYPTLISNTYTDGISVTPKYMAPV